MIRTRTAAALALVAACAACSDATPVAPEGAAALVPCVFRAGLSLEVGEAFTTSGSEAQLLCLEGGPAGAEYTLVPFFASRSGTARLRVAVLGGNVQPVTGPPNPSRAPGAEAPLRWAGEPVLRDEAAHMRFLERTRRQLEPRIRAGAGPARAARAPASFAVVPSVGDTLRINTSADCDVTDFRRGRVGAVTQTAILVDDVDNPAGGLTDADLRAFGATFDTLIRPVSVRNFGAPTDIDNNGRVIVFFTRAVNELTPPGSTGFVAGFFWAGDLFPRQDAGRLGGCPGSNVSEIFYVLAPDPEGRFSARPFSRDDVLRRSAGTIAHEFEHLINAGRRLFVNNAPPPVFEAPWLDEGLAHIAEELVFYAATPFEPRQNLTAQQVFSAPVLDETLAYMIQNLARYQLYLAEPDTNALMGIDRLETRGASWAFLRYAADREPGIDQNFFFRLVNGTQSGVANLETALREVTGSAVDPIDWMQDWTVSVYTDDAVPVEPRFLQPSWNFRSIEPVIGSAPGFPLSVRVLQAAGEPRQFSIRPGGAAFLRFGIGAGSRVAVSLRPEQLAQLENLRISLVRTK